MEDTKAAAPAAAAVEAVKSQQAAPDAQSTKQPETDPRMEQFARKERQLRKLQQEIAKEREAMKSKQSEYETNYIPKNRLSEDPLSVLNEAGVSYDKLTELILSQPNTNDPTIRALRSEIKAIKDAQEASRRAGEEAQSAQYEQAIKQIKNEVKLMVDGSQDYETIKEMGMQDAVTELIQQTFNEEGYLMDISEAAKQVEEHLIEESVKMAQLKKVQSRLAPKAPEVSEKVKAQDAQHPKTLTHNMTQESSSKLSAKAKRERAIAAFYGKIQG